MKELELIAREVAQLRACGKRAVLATVVSIHGSSYRLPGARMLIADQRWMAGSVSGGCLEGDVVLRAHDVLETNRATVATYDTTSDEDIIFGVGLGCRGIIRVLIEPIPLTPTEADLVDFIRRCLAQRETGWVATVIGSDGASGAEPASRLLRDAKGKAFSTMSNAALQKAIEGYLQSLRGSELAHATAFDLQDGSRVEVFIEGIRPPLPFVVFGAGHDAIPAVRFGKELGWHVTVVDHRAAYATPERFPLADSILVAAPAEIPACLEIDSETVALVMTHNYLRDLELLKILLPSPARYVGLLGPRRRAEELLAELDREGLEIAPAQRQRFYAPVGLDIGAEGPEGVALSVLAEMQAVIAGRKPGHLRERRTSIHGLEAAPHAASAVEQP